MQSLPLMENIKGYPEWERKYLVWAEKKPYHLSSLQAMSNSHMFYT